MHRGEPPAGSDSLSDFEIEYQAVQGLSDDEFVAHFGTRILVAGSRGFNNYEDFCDSLESAIDRKLMLEDGCFISGKASRGADDMIIRWCKENQILCREMPADWDLHGKSAGYIRNAHMAKVCNEAIIFWDLLSPGTKNMVNTCTLNGIKNTVFVFDSEESTPAKVKELQEQRFNRTWASKIWNPETD